MVSESLIYRLQEEKISISSLNSPEEQVNQSSRTAGECRQDDCHASIVVGECRPASRHLLERSHGAHGNLEESRRGPLPRSDGRISTETARGDLAGHGGEHRAVFVYQIESYRYWQQQLGRSDFVFGQFGENFTIEGLADDEVCIGDRYRIGGRSLRSHSASCDLLSGRYPHE